MDVERAVMDKGLEEEAVPVMKGTAGSGKESGHPAAASAEGQSSDLSLQESMAEEEASRPAQTMTEEEAARPAQTDAPTEANGAAEDAAAIAQATENGIEASAPIPDASAVKENDVKDECLAENGEHAKVEDEEDRRTMDILGNGKLIKRILTPGAGRKSRPESNDVVTLRVEGRLEDGTVVDKDDAKTFILNDGDVIHAFDLAVPLMEMGEECELQTDSKYAYGEMGREPDVPPNAAITYNLSLVERQPGPVYVALSPQEKFDLGEKKRERGNYLFTRKDWTGAINSYNKALRILESPGGMVTDDTLRESMKSCRLKCYNNLAACQLKGSLFDAVIRNCNEVLKIQPDNVKALFRAGKAYASKGDTKQAIVFLKRAVKHDPSNKSAQHELYLQTKKQQREVTSEKEMYQRMLGTKKPSPKKQTSSWRKPLVFGAAAAVLLSMGVAAYRYSSH